jgi:hypothetical protein
MVAEADPDQVQLTAHTLGVTVDQFGREALHGRQDLGQKPCESRYPLRAHIEMLTGDWLAIQ